MPRRWLQDSVQGFNRVSTLGTPKNEFALKLKGREADLIKLAPIAAPKLVCAIEKGVGNAQADPVYRLGRDSRRPGGPFRANAGDGEFPGIIPGLCFLGHFGPQIGNLQKNHRKQALPWLHSGLTLTLALTLLPRPTKR